VGGEVWCVGCGVFGWCVVRVGCECVSVGVSTSGGVGCVVSELCCLVWGVWGVVGG
jgi:hypothetical protein